MKTNQLKKGDRVQLRNGWYATIEDNRKGQTRMATVEGIYTEMGSIYSHDIIQAMMDGVWVTVEHTEAQEKCRKLNAALFTM